VVKERPDESGASRLVTAEDTAAVALRLENGVAGRIDISGSARGGLRRIEIYGTEGTLVLLDGAKLYRGRDGELEEVRPDHVDQGRLEDPRLGPFVELAQRVVDRLQGRSSGPITTFGDGLSVQRVMDAVRRSSDEGREVRVWEIEP
jgi:predicted dehydrogenase